MECKRNPYTDPREAILKIRSTPNPFGVGINLYKCSCGYWHFSRLIWELWERGDVGMPNGYHRDHDGHLVFTVGESPSHAK